MLQVRHTGIFVKDLERMKDFYCKFFNLHVKIHDIESGDYIANLYNKKGDNFQVELYKLGTEDGCLIELLKVFQNDKKDAHSECVYDWGCMHVAFTISDIDRVYKEMVGDGTWFYSEPQFSRDNMHKVCFCKDPEGNHIELVQDL